jgi:hypothetical protein
VVVSGAVRHQGSPYQAGQAFHSTTLVSLDIPADAVVLLAWPVKEALAQAA